MTTSPVPACAATLRDISAYLDGELDAAACAIIEQHGRECAACGAALDSLRETAGLCRHAAQVDFPDAVRQRAKAAVRRLLDSLPPDNLQGDAAD